MPPAPTSAIRTERLVLEPLRIVDASEMVAVLSDEALYTFTGGGPPSLAALEMQYTNQIAGPSSGEEVWHNWVIRPAATGRAVGFVQATVTGAVADVAWVMGVDWQGRGFASEAASAMCGWLQSQGVEQITAHIHPRHVASQRVAVSVGLQPTREVDSDGEVVWLSVPQATVGG